MISQRSALSSTHAISLLLLSISPCLISTTPLPLVSPSTGLQHSLQHNLTSVALPEDQNSHYAMDSPAAELQDWPDTGRLFPNPFTENVACNRPDNAYNRNWVCDPNQQLSPNDVIKLSDKIESMLSNFKCVCPSCSTVHPKGRFSIGIALADNITGSGSDLDRTKMLSFNLRTKNWVNMKRCNDMVVIGLSTTGRTVYLSTDPRVALIMDSTCISDILDKTKSLYQAGDWYKALDSTLDYVRNALDGGACGSKSGLSVGQIVGIVIGVLAGVSMIVSTIIICVGFFQDWECVAGTCLGVCVGCVLAQLQACINAIIFSIFQSLLEECGCEDCCDCDPLSCVPEDSPDAGGGMEY